MHQVTSGLGNVTDVYIEHTCHRPERAVRISLVEKRAPTEEQGPFLLVS